jgi:hypothetical protein
VSELTDKIRGICVRLIDEPSDSLRNGGYRSELNIAAGELAAELKVWNSPTQGDKHQVEARQSYRSCEVDSADGFTEGLKLFNPKKRDSEKPKN